MESSYQEPKNVRVADKELLNVEEQKYAPSRSPSPRRRSNESSPTRSEYSDSLPSVGGIVIDAFNSKSGYNIRLKNPQGMPLYYVDNSTFTPSKPDVTLCAGDDREAPVVGVAKWSSMYSKSVMFGIGDTKNNEGRVKWEEMKSDKHRHIEFKWSLDMPDAPSRNFIWRRAKKDDSEDVNRFSTKNFKLVDEATGETVALFCSNRLKSWSKLGKFTINADYGETWRVAVLLTALALIEMSRRRSRARRSQGGHGGS